jgi:hypothetical protein
MVQRWLLHPAAKPVLWLLLAAPAAALLWRGVHDALGPNPAEALIRGLGDWTLRLLCLTLLVTPLRTWTGWHALARWRRSLGVGTFLYGTLHWLAYAWLDQGLDWPPWSMTWPSARSSWWAPPPGWPCCPWRPPPSMPPSAPWGAPLAGSPQDHLRHRPGGPAALLLGQGRQERLCRGRGVRNGHPGPAGLALATLAHRGMTTPNPKERSSPGNKAQR